MMSRNGAVASGSKANVNASLAVRRQAVADSTGFGNLAVTLGKPGHNAASGVTQPSRAFADGTFTRAVVIGNGSEADTFGTAAHPRPFNSTAAVFGKGSTAKVTGSNRFAIAIGRNKTVEKN